MYSPRNAPLRLGASGLFLGKFLSFPSAQFFHLQNTRFMMLQVHKTFEGSSVLRLHQIPTVFLYLTQLREALEISPRSYLRRCWCEVPLFKARRVSLGLFAHWLLCRRGYCVHPNSNSPAGPGHSSPAGELPAALVQPGLAAQHPRLSRLLPHTKKIPLTNQSQKVKSSAPLAARAPGCLDLESFF